MARTLVGMSPFPVMNTTGRCEPLAAVNASLNLQTVKTRHRNIQYGTSGYRHIMLFEEYLRRRIGLDFIALGAEQSRKRFQDSGVIINKVDCEFVCHAATDRRLLSGQRKSCNGTAALVVDQSEPSTMRLYDGRTDRQPQTETMGLGGIEWFKQPAIFLGTDAVPPILYEHVYHSVFRPTGRNQDIPLGHRGRGHGIHRIHDKIKQDLLQLHRIARVRNGPDPDRA